MADVEALLSVLVVLLGVGYGPSGLWKLPLGFAVFGLNGCSRET
jgi:hypothetical protein